ncbi:universal stress protein [Segetibacter koreensis]|uniref:universal stress protein n=1 Tax=Segetibacter koreensis TaxID=398037 RepID=UPI000368A2D9|nr:universal stress protein [Segetibacter koreensis]
METILIATDFSPASHNAMVYGVELAKFLQAKLALLHVCEPILSATDTVVVMTGEELKEQSNQLLHKEIQDLQGAETLNVEYFVEEGLPSETIKWVAKRVKAKWIVTGMRGGGGIARKIFGSTAISLSRKPCVPLIIVPEHARFAPPKSIALASDIGDETDVRIIDPLEEFGIKCNATMYVVRVIKKGMDEFLERLMRPTRVKWHCRELHPSFEFVSNNDVAHAMNEFVKEHNVDLIAMVAHEHNIFERLFVKSDIKEMMFRTHVPVVILPEKPAAQSNKVDDEVDDSVAQGHA